MSAIHTLYKQLCRSRLVITLLCTVLFGNGGFVHASNEVMVSLSALYDIMPPEASVYKETPEKFFVVNINNPQDHTLTIYLTMKLEKISGEKFVMEQKVSAMPQSPMFAITLPASTSITLSPTQLHNHFRHLGLNHFNITGTLLGNVMSSNFGLLPEGDYMATLTAYEYKAGEKVVEKTKEALSDPKLSTTHFKICYSVKAPVLQVPLGVAKVKDPNVEEEPQPTFAGVDYEIPDINFNNATNWTWLHLMEVCGQLPNMNYELEFYSMKNGSKGYYTSPENAIVEGNDRVLLYPGTLGPKLTNVQSATIMLPNPKSYFLDGEYYAVRVHATPTGGTSGSSNAKLATFRMYENDGYSRPIVIRAVPEGENSKEKDEPKKDDQNVIVDSNEPQNDAWRATVTHPKLTFPDNEGNCFGAVYIEAGKDYECTWKKPEFVEGDREFAEKFDYTYNINIYKAPADAATFDDIITEDNKPIYTVSELKFKDKEELKHTVPWQSLSEDEDKGITLGGHYFIEVTANPVPKPKKEGELIFCARGQNCCTYTMFLTEDIVYEDCGAIVDYPDKTVVSHGETIEKKQAEFNGFHVVFTNLKATDEAKTTYAGTGYVKWQPLDMSTYIAMSFTGIRLNKDMQVIAGTGMARKMENSDVIPYDLIDYAAAKAGNWVKSTDAYKDLSEAASVVGEAVQQATQWVDSKTGVGAENKLNQAQQSANAKVQALYDAHVTKWRDPDEVAKACGDYWTKYIMPGRNAGNTLLNWLKGGSYDDVDTDASPTFLPIGLPQSFLPDSLDMDFQVMKFDITPTRASVGVAAFFYMPDAVRIDKAGEEVKDGTRLSTVLAFVAPRLCVKPQEIWAKEGEFGLLYDFSIKDMSTGYTFTFLAPTDYTHLNDGCAIHWEQVKGKTKCNMMVLDAKMTIPGLLNEDRSRMAELRIGARIDNWSDWMAWIAMDAFQLEDLDGYVFNVTGANGIRLDHSRVKNPDLKDASGNAITISEIFKDVRRGDNSGKKGYDWAHPKLGFQKVPAGKDPMNWMGLYVDEISMTFPKALAITDKSDEKAGPLKLGLRNLLWDNSGVSLTAFVGSENNPVVKLETGRLGGWALSLNEVAVNVLQSNFSDCHFNGMFKLPLLDGTFDYECKMNYVVGEELGQLYAQHNIGAGDNDEKKLHLTFTTQQRDEMNLDFWLGSLNLDKNGSWFNIDYLDGDTQVEFMASGTVTLGEANENKTAGKVKDVPFDIPGIRFAGLRMANYKYDTKRDFAKQYAQKLARDTYNNNSKAFDQNSFQAGLNKELSEADFEGGSVDYPFYFNIGRWSLASEEKKMWGFPLRVKDVGVEPDTSNKRIGLKFTGELGLVGNGKDTDGDGEKDSWALTAGAGMTIWAKYEFKGFKDLGSASIGYDGFTFNKLYFDGSFGGGLVTVKGELDWEDNDEKKGFKGDLTLGVKELFDVTVAGGIWELKKENYKNGYFYANVGDVNIPCGPTGVVINRLSCGFFWNRTMPANTKLDDKEKFREAMAGGGVAQNKCFGLTFGLGLAFANETLCSGDFNGFMAYDLKNDALSRLTLLGDMDALKGPEAKKGLLNARVKIDYVDNVAESNAAKEKIAAGDKNTKAVERCQSFTLSVTVDFKADTKEALEQFLGKGTMDKLEDTLKNAAQKIKDSGMSEFGADAADEDNKGDGKTSGKDGAKNNLTASAGASFNFEFQLRHYRDKKETKWHVYLGEPARGKRCEIVFIDFKFDSALLKVWAKAYANAYLCLGNELPKDENGVEGGLPPLPDKLIQILDGKDSKSSKSVETNAPQGSLQTERAKQIQTGPSGSSAGIKGGIQFGAEAGAEFGVQIPIGYVNVGALVGFDAVLKQYGDCACSDGSQLGGKNGFYAMAQIYAALWGAAGVSLDFGFWRGDFPLVDVAFGAVLKGGFPNPSWVYGKMRVKGEVLGGLISFNKAMELRMGKVCVPEVASPLEGIDIFSSYTVGSEDKNTGWGSKGDGKGATLADPYVMPSFTTNMNMDSQLRLVDENEMNTKAGLDGDIRAAEASSTKTFVFHLERDAVLQAYSNSGSAQGAPKYCDMTPAQNSRTSFTVNTGSLNQYQNYKLHIRGFVKQIIDGREQDPIIRNLETHKDEQKSWGQNLDLYFRTDKWSDDLSQEVMLFMPFDETGVILQDAENPYFSIANPRTDMFNSPDKEWYVNMEVNRGTARSPKWQYPDIRYDASGARLTSELSKWEHIGIELTTEYDGSAKFYNVGLVTPPGTTSTIEKNTQYRFSLYSVDKKQMNDDLNKIKEASKSIVSGGADVLETLTLLAYDEDGKMTDLGKDMMAWYNEQTNANNQFSSSKDKVDQAITDFQKNKLSDLRYTSLEFQREFTTGTCKTFAEKLKSSDNIYSSQTLKFRKNTVTRKGGAISARMNPKAKYDQLSSSTESNPYRMLNWWATTACVSMMPSYRFTSKYGDESVYYMKNADLISYVFSDQWHGNPKPAAKLWGSYEFEKAVSPFYAEEWRSQYRSYAITGQSLTKNMVDSVCKVLYTDGRMAADLPLKLRTYWDALEKYALGKNKTTGVTELRDKDVSWEWLEGSAHYGFDESGDIVDVREYNRSHWSEEKKGYFTAFSSNDTYFNFPFKQLCCIFTCDVYSNADFMPIWDFYITRDSYTSGSKWGKWGKGTFNSYHTWSGVTRRGSTNAIYWIAGEAAPDRAIYPFSMSKFLNTIKELTFEVRRPTGYDANSGKFLLRPSTRFGNMVDVTQKVTLSDNGSSVKVTTNGSITTKEDNSVHFNDPFFESYILAKFDSNRDGMLSKEEALKIRYIDFNGREKGTSNGSPVDIYNLQGIEAMTNLESLKMDRVTLRAKRDANLSNNKKLRRIQFTFGWTDRAQWNGILEMPDLSGLPALDSLHISHHSTSADDVSSDKWGGLSGTIDASTLPKLKYLSLPGNNISGISNLDSQTRLEYLDIGGNRISGTINASTLQNTYIYAGQQHEYASRKYKISNSWVTLKLPAAYPYESTLISNGAKVGNNSGSNDKNKYNYRVQVTKTDNLKEMIAQLPDPKLITYIAQNYNSGKTSMGGYTLEEYAKKYYNNQLTVTIARNYLGYFTLKEEDIVKTTSLNVSDKGIKSLKGLVKVMPYLSTLRCYRNDLEELDLSGFTRLTYLDCDLNHIVSLVCPEKVTTLLCSNNALTTLDLSKAKNLQTLYCNKNGLTELVLANSPKLTKLECKYNQLKSLDASMCTSLTSLDCSYNTSMVHAGTVGGALWVSLYVPKSIEKLIARGIYVNDGFGYMSLNLPNLTWLDMSENPTITNYVDTKASTKLQHLDLHETGIIRLYSETKNLNYLDLSKSKLMYHGSTNNYYVRQFDVDMYSTDWRNLKTLDVSDTQLNRVYVRSYSDTYVLDNLYVGVPNRTTGTKVELQADTRTMGKWEKSWKNSNKNKYVFAHWGTNSGWASLNNSNMNMEYLSKSDETMHRNLGEELYSRLKKKYAPSDRWLHTNTVSAQVKELDCSGLNITDIDSIVLWMPNLEKLNCSHNLIKKANFSKLMKLKSLNIGRNADLSSLTMPKNSLVYDVIDVSYTNLSRYFVTNLMYDCKKFIAAGVESLNGTLYVRSNQPLTYVDVEHTNIEDVDLYCPKLETFKANYCSKLKTVKVENSAKTFKATCGGVNGNVEVQLCNESVAKKWFDNSANNSLNENTLATYLITFNDGKTRWVPVASAQGAVNLANFCKKNVNYYRLAVKDKQLALTLFGNDVTPWFANNYGQGNDNLTVEFTVNVAGTVRYVPITSLDGAKNLAAFARTLTSPTQLNVTNNRLSVWIFTLDQLNMWFETLDKDYAYSSDVKLRLVFKNSKALMLPVAKKNYKARINLFNFCKKIDNDQLILSDDGEITLNLTNEEKKIWTGENTLRNANDSQINYSSGNEDVNVTFRSSYTRYSIKR